MGLSLSLGLNLGAVNLTAGVGVSYEAEATALFARFTTPPDTTRKGHINTLIKALKTAGVWSKLDALYLLAAADAQAARQNWITDAYNLAVSGSPTFLADRYYAGDGTAAYLESSFNPTTAVAPKFTQNDASMFAWSLTNNNNAGALSNEVGNANSRLGRSINLSGVIAGRVNTSATINSIATGAFPGLGGWSRSAAAVWEGYGAGVDAGGGTDASAALTNTTFRVLMATGVGNGVNQMSVAGWGSNLTSQQWAALYSALGNYLVALGAAVGPF